MSTYADEQGQWHALRQGMPVPTTAIDDLPQLSLCFNEQWRPSIITALKLLTRPEAWVGSDADIRAAVREAHGLLAGFLDGCGTPVAAPNWQLNYHLDAGAIDTEAWNTPRLTSSPMGVPQLVYELVLYQALGVPADITIKGEPRAGSGHVGGKFANIRVSNEIPSGQAYVLTTVDCLGGIVVNSDFTTRNYNGDFQTLRIVTGNVSAYLITLTIEGDYLCAGA